jgi:predicted aspartyl protease
MPYFTRPVAPNGFLLVNAFAQVSMARRNALTALNQPVPPPVQVIALIDTGASCVCIDPSVITQLGLTPTGSCSITTPSTGAQRATMDEYDIGLVVIASVNAPPLIRHAIPAVAAELFASQGFHMIIGMDVLKECLLTFDGQAGLFSLAY